MIIRTFNHVKAIYFAGLAIILMAIVSCRQPEPELQRLLRLAYVSDGTLHVAGLNDNTQTRAGKGSEPSLSMDGRYLAYVTMIGAKQRIAILDFPNRNTTIIEDVQGTSWRPVWSPVENRYLFSASVQDQELEYRVVVVGHAREDKKYLLSRPGTDIFMPAWAPDGQTIYGHDTQLMYQWEKTGLLINHFNLAEKFGPLNFNSSTIIMPSADGSRWLIATGNQEPDGRPRRTTLDIHIFTEATGTLEKISPENALIGAVCWGWDNNTLIISAKERQNQRNFDIFQFDLAGKKSALLVKNASQPSFQSIVVGPKNEGS